MSLEIYCSVDTQDVPHQVPLGGQDPSGDTNQDHLYSPRQRLDNLDSGEQVNIDKTPAQSSITPSSDDNIQKTKHTLLN